MVRPPNINTTQDAMDIQRFDSGSRMSQAVVHGNTVYLAGQVGDGEGVTEQTRSPLAKVDKWLAETGTDKSRLLSMTVWLASMSDFAEMNAVYDAWIDPANPPARAAGEAKLATPALLVEFIAIAARP